MQSSESKIIKEIEELLKIQIVDVQIPPQGMDSKVFFVVDENGKGYAIKQSDNVLNDLKAFELLLNNHVDVPIPKVFGSFTYDGKLVIILERIDFPLLETIPHNQIHKFIPSMINNLIKIHSVKSDSTGLLSDINNKKDWKDSLLSIFMGNRPGLNWKEIVLRDKLDSNLILESIENIVKEIEKTELINKQYSLLHTDFNQRNLFVNPDTYKIASIIDWGEAMFGDPIYDFANVRLFMWHFNLDKKAIDNFYELLNLTYEQIKLIDLYQLSRIIEYMAYYSVEQNDFNVGRIKLHQDFLRNYDWKKLG